MSLPVYKAAIRPRLAFLVVLGLSLVLSVAVYFLVRRPQPGPAPPPPSLLTCDRTSFRLDRRGDTAELLALEDRSPEPRWRLRIDASGPVDLACEGGRLRVRAGAGPLVLASIDAPSWALIPGVPLAGGSQEAPFAAVAWGGAGLALSPGRFLWSDLPRRFEARFEREAFLDAGGATDAVSRGYRGAGQKTMSVRGRVDPPAAGAVVVALDRDGKLAAAATSDDQGAFELVAPSIETAFVAVGSSRAGPAARPAADGLVLGRARVGGLRVEVRDHDTTGELPARLVIHGHDGAREPNLGPPHRATGAGPLLDAEDGKARLILPAGRYRVLATRGPEYTIDERVVEVPEGGEASAELRLRRVIDTPGWASCDLHVHSRGSFDSWVATDDRVRSLMAAGVDFAVPSEHNRIGSYDASQLGGQGKWLTWVPAVEVTTVDPPRGHFNVFPYDGEPPKHRRTSLAELLGFVRRESPASLVQVNHPRMGPIGHFNALHLDEQTQRGLGMLARGFELLEIYNGFDLAEPAKNERYLLEWMRLLERGRTHWAVGNSDSHGVQYVAPGYPRTYAAVRDDHDGGEGAPLDVAALLAGLRGGKAFATSGPFVEVSQGPRGPGEALDIQDGKARIKVKIRAAPWVPVHELEVYAGARSALRRELTPRPVVTGPPQGTLDQARSGAVLLDEELDVPVPAGARAVVVVVRGGKSNALPFMDWPSLAIVNPLLRPD